MSKERPTWTQKATESLPFLTTICGAGATISGGTIINAAEGNPTMLGAVVLISGYVTGVIGLSLSHEKVKQKIKERRARRRAYAIDQKCPR